MGALFGGGSTPKPPPPPPPPPTIDQAAQEADAMARQRQRRGYAATLLTQQPLGSPNVGTSKLLGD